MPYELTLRPKSTDLISKESLGNKLLSAGLKVHPDSIPPGMLCDDLALFAIVADPEVPAGVRVLVKIPYGQDFFDLTIELLNLELLARAIDANMLDGEEVMDHSVRGDVAFHTRYRRASEAAIAIFGVA
jgi:hypothetical protein